MYLRKSTKTILLILVLVAIVTAVVISILQTPSTSVDTSEWKTYTNDHFGFSLKYPPTWKVTENPEAARIPKIPSYQPLNIVTIDTRGKTFGDTRGKTFGIGIVSGSNPSGLITDPGNHRKATTTVEGQNRQVLFNDSNSLALIFVSRGNFTFLFDLSPTQDLRGDFSEMLTSFKFTK